MEARKSEWSIVPIKPGNSCREDPGREGDTIYENREEDRCLKHRVWNTSPHHSHG